MTNNHILKNLAHAPLVDQAGTTLQASALWNQQPALVVVLRRPGCILCRAEAQRLWKLSPEIKALGINMVCVVKEWKQQEIDGFHPEFWPGPVYHDTTMAFYKAVNGGNTVHKGSILSLMNPFGVVWQRVRQARGEVAKHNLVGEGLIMGGLMVVGKGGTGPYLVHLEKDLGDHADHDDVMKAVKKAADDANETQKRQPFHNGTAAVVGVAT